MNNQNELLDRTPSMFRDALKSGGSVEFESNDDILMAFHNNTSNSYTAIFNGKPVFGFKKFSRFRDELLKWIERYGLTIISE